MLHILVEVNRSAILRGQDISELFLDWFLLWKYYAIYVEYYAKYTRSIYVNWFQLPRKHQYHSKTHTVRLRV